MFGPEVINAFKAHALEEYPKEACGVVVGGVYIRKANIAENPLESFEIDPLVWIDHEGEIQAILHSHPDGPDYPSETDMRHQMTTDVPWGICTVKNGIVTEPFFWGDGVPIPPLLGRSFRHGVTDCYALARDYYRVEKGIYLPEFPRNYEWWYKGEDHYTQNFKEIGFEPVAEPKAGDAFFMRIHSNVVNHAGIVLGDGTIMHHLVNRLSGREPGFRWRKFITTYLRYTG